MVTAVKRQISKKTGKEYARLTLEDFHGTAEAIVFPCRLGRAVLRFTVAEDRQLVVLFCGAALFRRDEAAPSFEPIAAAAPRAAAPLLVDDFADGDLQSVPFGEWTTFTDRIPLLLGTSEASLSVVSLDDEPGRRALRVRGRVTRDARFELSADLDELMARGPNSGDHGGEGGGIEDLEEAA